MSPVPAVPAPCSSQSLPLPQPWHRAAKDSSHVLPSGFFTFIYYFLCICFTVMWVLPDRAQQLVGALGSCWELGVPGECQSPGLQGTAVIPAGNLVGWRSCCVPVSSRNSPCSPGPSWKLLWLSGCSSSPFLGKLGCAAGRALAPSVGMSWVVPAAPVFWLGLCFGPATRSDTFCSKDTRQGTLL